jgi:hypothetical protein
MMMIVKTMVTLLFMLIYNNYTNRGPEVTLKMEATRSSETASHPGRP